MKNWIDSVPTLDRFAQVSDPTCYRPVPDEWWIGVSDVVNSTLAIDAGRYKAVNLAGAGTISAVSNVFKNKTLLFVFGGDGARFVISPDSFDAASEALSRVAMWAKRDLDLDLRVGMVRVAEARAAGFDVCAAWWQASRQIRYAMFTGGGLEWADAGLKAGAFGLKPAGTEQDPDLTGLSCQWGALKSKQGSILSLIVKPTKGASVSSFNQVSRDVVAILEGGASFNPVPVTGPDVGWPSASIQWQSRIAHRNTSIRWRRLRVLATTAIIWLIFKLGIRIGQFDANRYRRRISENTDFRKFDDGLLVTVDCSTDTVTRLRELLGKAKALGVVRYGMHIQQEALITCVVPSVLALDHMHFVDGAGGGYAAAYRDLQGKASEPRSALPE